MEIVTSWPVVYQLNDPRYGQYIGIAHSPGGPYSYWRCNGHFRFGRSVDILEQLPHGTTLAEVQARADYYSINLNIPRILEPLWPN
jgi:hypothetical protein